MLTTPTARKNEKLWPSLASNCKEKTSFFGDEDNKKLMKSSKECNDSEHESEDDECKAPEYKNSLSDALVNALKTASLNENSRGKKNKKKAKKTLLFSSGMNFN